MATRPPFFFDGGGLELVWQAEAEGEPVLRTLVELLVGEPAQSSGVTVWPEAFADQDVEYLGWRVGIDSEGT